MAILTDKPKQLFVIFISGLIFYILSLIITSILYPGGFSMLTGAISDLGAPSLNPYYWLSILGHVVISIVSILVLIRTKKQIKMEDQQLFKTKFFWGIFLNILGCSGLMGVGVIHEDFGEIHGLFGSWIFIGFIFGSLMFGKAVAVGTSFANPMNKEQFERFGKIICITLLVILGMGGVIIVIQTIFWDGGGPVTPTLAEWLCLFVFLIWLTMIALESTQSPLLNQK
jgi:hypothetical protein